jgi:hypothetical protein
MIHVRKIAAQGDVLFRRIAHFPAGVAERKRRGESLVVAHSETGHHHAIDDPEVRFFQRLGHDGMVSFLSVDGEFADVVHHRPHDTHETLRLPRGNWEVRRQREWTSHGPWQVED